MHPPTPLQLARIIPQVGFVSKPDGRRVILSSKVLVLLRAKLEARMADGVLLYP